VLRHAPLLVLAASTLAVACQPWYRDDLLRGRRAQREGSSNALDYVAPATAQPAVGASVPRAAGADIPGAPELARAASLASTDPRRALAQYGTWLGVYGVPDHPSLRASRDRILKAAWADREINAVLTTLLRRADLAAAAGRVPAALVLYSQAFRQVPEAVFEAHAPSFLRAAAAVKDPAAIDPLACYLAAQGDVALKEKRLITAIRRYRRVVAIAPWWSAAHHNLAILLDMDGRGEESRLQRKWAVRIQAEAATPAGKPDPTAVAGRSAWSVAQAVLPSDVKVVASINVAAARATPLYASLYPLLADLVPGVKDVLGQMKPSCGIDASEVIDRLVVAIDTRDRSVVFAQVKDVNEPWVTDCVVEIARSHGNAYEVARRARGNATLVELSAIGRDLKLYAVWNGSVVAITTDPTDLALLDKMTGGNDALTTSAALATGLAKIDRAALGWMVMSGPVPMDGGTAEVVSIQVTSAASSFQLDWRNVMTNAAEAQASVATLRQELADGSTSARPEVARLAKSVQVSAKGDEVAIRGTFAEVDVLALLQMLSR